MDSLVKDVKDVGSYKPTIVVVPSDIHRALIRNKLCLSDYVMFDKVKKALSSEDIKHWYAVIENVKIGGKRLGDHLMCAANGNSGDYSNASFAHFDPYYYPSEIELQEAKKYLYQSNAMTENFYSLYRDGSIVFVVVEPGFSLMIEDNTNKLEFLKSYFRKLAEFMPVHELAKNQYHLEYVSLVTT